MTLQRLRIHYQKNEGMRYTSNLDIQRVWERSLRRAGLQVAYSQGFHPQARIQQGCPLPLGFLSLVEVVDIWLEAEEIEPAELRDRIQACVPAGLLIQAIEYTGLQEQALQARGLTAEYRAVLLDPIERVEVESRVSALLAQESLPRTRRGKVYDLRPLVLALEIDRKQAEDLVELRMVLSAREGATGRPDEVLDALGFDPLSARIERTGLVFEPDGRNN